MMSEYWNSSPLTPPADSKPMEKVDSPCWPASASRPTIRLESTPPESRHPTGTSATRRRCTANRSVDSTASSQSRSDQSERSSCLVKSGAQRSGRHVTDAAQDGGRGGHHRVETHVVVQRDRVDPGVHAAAGQQGRQTRREPDPMRVL